VGGNGLDTSGLTGTFLPVSARKSEVPYPAGGQHRKRTGTPTGFQGIASPVSGTRQVYGLSVTASRILRLPLGLGTNPCRRALCTTTYPW